MEAVVLQQTGLKQGDYEAVQIPLGYEFIAYDGSKAERVRQLFEKAIKHIRKPLA